MKIFLLMFVAFVIGEVVGWIACAFLSVNKIIDEMDKHQAQRSETNAE